MGAENCPVLNDEEGRVALARRLAIIMHAMLRHSSTFQAA
jgi:hypothetical protein